MRYELIEPHTCQKAACMRHPRHTRAEKIMKIVLDDVEKGKYEETFRIKPPSFDSNVEVVELLSIQNMKS